VTLSVGLIFSLLVAKKIIPACRVDLLYEKNHRRKKVYKRENLFSLIRAALVARQTLALINQYRVSERENLWSVSRKWLKYDKGK
jgi:hypothetical protein